MTYRKRGEGRIKKKKHRGKDECKTSIRQEMLRKALTIGFVLCIALSIEICAFSRTTNAEVDQSILLYVLSDRTDSGKWYHHPNDLDPLVSYLKNYGYSIQVEDKLMNPELLLSHMLGYDQVWVLESDKDNVVEVTQREANNLYEYHELGHGIWISMETGPESNEWAHYGVWNEDALVFANKFGVECPHDATGPSNGRKVTSTHPLFKDINYIRFDGEVGCLTETNIDIKSIWSYKSGCNGIMILDSLEKGKGRVVFDSGWAIGYAFWRKNDDLLLAKNIADWLSITPATPTPSPSPSPTPTPTPTENHPPNAIRIEPVSEEVSINVGDTITFKVKVEDPDDEVHNNLKMIEWFVDDVLMETASADGKSAEVSFSYTFENRGTFSVKATVYDEQMEEASITWEVNVGEEEPEGLIEQEILDNEGNEIGLKVIIEYPTTLSQRESGYSELGWLDIKLKTGDFEDATFPDGETNLKSGCIMIASNEDMYVDVDGVEFEVAPVPQRLHHEAFWWEGYELYLRQEMNEWGWRTLVQILSVVPGSSQLMTLQEAFDIVWKEIEYDIGREPLDTSFYDMNTYDIWEYPWTFELNSIAWDKSEQRGNGVHLRMPFVYEGADEHEIHVFLFIEDYKSYGYWPFDRSYTIGKEYTCDINVGGNKMSGITSEKTEIPLQQEKGIP